MDARYKKLFLLKQSVKKKLVGFVLFFAFNTLCYANPEGGVVTAGDATINQVPNHTEIQQQSAKTIIDWHSFNIGKDESVHFQQPTDGIALNRIDSAQGVSQIFGQLSATGKIVLVNQAGIYFGPSARVDVGSLIASAANITNENFLAGKLTFDQVSAAAHGAIINEGIITAAKHGLIALVGPGVVNNGTISAHLGTVVLASGSRYAMDFYGDELINFVTDETTVAAVDQNGNILKNGVSHTGKIEANGGTILITANNAAGIVDNAINMQGVAQANSVETRNGEIVLSGGNNGQVKVSGKLEASGYENQATGGVIEVTGQKVDIASSSVIDVSGNQGGGEILIGAQYFDPDTIMNPATEILIEPFAKLLADATLRGDGGNILLWADETVKAYGDVSARGGLASGNGGSLGICGATWDVNGLRFDLHAPHGEAGVVVGLRYN